LEARAIGSTRAGTGWLVHGPDGLARNLAAPVRSFLNAETGGAIALLGATAAALLLST
jgi:hypothetical protein